MRKNKATNPPWLTAIIVASLSVGSVFAVLLTVASQGRKPTNAPKQVIPRAPTTRLPSDQLAAREAVRRKYSENERREIFRKWEEAADRADAVATERHGELRAGNLTLWSNTQSKLEEQFTLEVMREYDVTKKELVHIGIEAAKKRWW